MFSLGILFLILSKELKNNIRNKKKKHRIPNGEITYTDLNKPGKTLFSIRNRVSGKPDYIIKKYNQNIPVEVKFGMKSQPELNHVFQLACYCQLLEDAYGSLVPYGIIIYKNSDFKIPFTPKLRFELDSIIKKMRKSINTKIELNHNDPNKCRGCSMRAYCGEKLV